jgi:hypothetical protein
MRKTLNIALVIVGISASVMASPRLPASPNGTSNVAEVPLLHVALPAGMKDFRSMQSLCRDRGCIGGRSGAATWTR